MISPERAELLAKAVISNIDNWLISLEEIELNANPGNKARIMHLMISMGEARKALRHMIGQEVKPKD